MENLDILFKHLTGKDEAKAQEVASYLVESANIDLFKMLVDKSDYLFDFVKQNVCKRLSKSINPNNYKNILKFFNVYSDDYADLFINILAENADENLTDEVLEMLENGNLSQKTYAAKYFSYIPDTVSIEFLSKYAFCDDDGLSFNSAEALGQMNDDISYDISLNSLNSDDDIERLKAVKFFVAYGKKYPLKEIIEAMNTSRLPENIAGQIPYMVSLTQLLDSEFEKDIYTIIDNIVIGLGEILPLSDIFQFEMYEIIERFISLKNSEYSSKIAKILLRTLVKFKLFVENTEYMFDETKETKHEVTSILKLLQTQSTEFWQKQKEYISEELNGSDAEIISVLPIIVELNLTENTNKLKELLNTDNEILVCELITALSKLNALDGVNVSEYVKNMQNENIKAVLINLLI